MEVLLEQYGSIEIIWERRRDVVFQQPTIVHPLGLALVRHAGLDPGILVGQREILPGTYPMWSLIISSSVGETQPQELGWSMVRVDGIHYVFQSQEIKRHFDEERAA
jgi:hypothetical protein